MIHLFALLFAITGDISPEATAKCEAYVSAARRAYATEAFADYTSSLVTQKVYSCKERKSAQYRQPAARTVRWMHVEGSANFRDIGGWTGLRTNLAYRGAEVNCHTNADYLCSKKLKNHDLFATREGLRTLSDAMKIRTDLDLRGASESPTPNETPIPGARLCRIPLSSYTNCLVTTQGRLQLAKALRIFTDRANYPIYFHCYGGADRTGTLALILEGLCGVSEADCAVDYELTTFGLQPRPRCGGGYFFAETIAELKKRQGATFKDKVTTYVTRDLGLNKEEIASIREILTGSAEGL